MRLMTAAACLCIVAAVFFGYWLISPARLQKISLGTVGFSGEGAGAHTPVVRDISEYTTGNPWSAEMKLKRLPVYKNTQSLSYDELLSTVRKTAEKSGAQIKSVTQETLPECEWVVSENSLYAVRAETDIGTVSAYVTGDVNIVFTSPSPARVQGARRPNISSGSTPRSQVSKIPCSASFGTLMRTAKSARNTDAMTTRAPRSSGWRTIISRACILI